MRHRVNINCVRGARFVKRSILETLKLEGVKEPCEVNVLLCDDETIHALNKDFRGIDRATDVLSFPANELARPFVLTPKEEIEFNRLSKCFELGDIAISLPTARRQAEEYAHSRRRELSFLAAHGCLHLLGYDHMNEEEERVMLNKQQAVMNALGVSR